MEQSKRHILTLAWPEESGQCSSLGLGGTPVGIFQRFTADAPARGYKSTAHPVPRLIFVFRLPVEKSKQKPTFEE
jgi:hypothetical protein